MTRLCVGVLWLALAAAASAQTPEELLKSARAAVAKKNYDEAVKLASQAIKANPKSLPALSLRASLYERLEKYAESAADYTAILMLNKSLPEAYQQRGLLKFKMGKVKESIEDFDLYLELKPKAKASHWQRGIAFYYGGRYDDGRKQFEGYQDFDSNDVENAVWRFMCMTRKDGIEAARKAMLKIGEDERVPMRQVYGLFKGDLKIEDVLKAAKAKDELFYAHLYVGIYHDLLNQKKAALAHLNQATDEYRIAHYMWDVARVHRDLLAKELKSAPESK